MIQFRKRDLLIQQSHNSIDELIAHQPFNVFVGAGVSRPPPSCAPVWRELQRMFIEGLFVSVSDKGWVSPGLSSADRDALIAHPFRPEQFWGFVRERCSTDLVARVLSGLSLGRPNSVHRTLVELARTRTIKNIITTNFDCYLEQAAGAVLPVVVESRDWHRTGDPPSGIILKLHGSLDRPATINFVLEDTTRLSDWKKDLFLAATQNIGLLVVGYSGFDDDVFPLLRTVVRAIPRTVVVVHPGSTGDEPVRELSSVNQGVSVIEVDFGLLLPVLLGRSPNWGTDANSDLPDVASFVRTQIAVEVLPFMPYLISSLFQFAGHASEAYRYAEIGFDVVEEEGTVRNVDEVTRVRIVDHYVSALSRVASSDLAQFHHRLQNRDARFTRISESIADRITLAWNSVVLGRSPSADQVKESTMWAAGALGLVRTGIIQGAELGFRAAWCLARLRSMAGDSEAAVAAYSDADRDLPRGLGVVEFGSFCLDYGSAAFELGVKNTDESLLALSERLFGYSEQAARRSADHLTHAQALMMLARLDVFAGRFELSKQRVAEANRISITTGDKALRKRAEAILEWVTDAAGRLGNESP